MNISWYGHRCVRIETKAGSVLIDPFDPKQVGLRGPSIKDDIVLISEAAPSPAVLERVNDSALLIRGPGEYEKNGIAVHGIQAYQDSQQGAELGLCALYVVIAEELSVCHLGALGQEHLTDAQLEAIGDPDILLVPAGGQSALDPKAAAALVNRIEPKIVIPIQQAVKGASYDAQSVERFVKEIGLPPQSVDTYRIAKKLLPMDKTELVVINI